MGKAKAIETTEKKGGQGKKICPSCNEVNAARSGECKKCGHKFVPKTAKSAKSNAHAVDVEKIALRFALAEGGIDKALKSLADYEEDNLARFVAECGGLENAKEQLTKLKT